MRETKGQVDQLVNRLGNSSRAAEQSLRALTEQSESWDDHRRFTEGEIRPMLDRWHRVLDKQHDRLSTNRLRSLVQAISRANHFASSVGLHPRVLLKHAEIHLISILRWFKVILFLLLWLAILAGTLSLAAGVVMLAIRVAVYLIAILGDALQELLRQITALL